MANYSDSTRKEQVLAKLKAHAGEWVNGVDLANEQVGGSEGLKRLRELKREGWLIQMRKSPAQGSDQFQYRLAVQLRTDGSLAYYDPALHPEDRPEQKEVQNGGPTQPDRDRSDHRSGPDPQRTQSTWMDPNPARNETSIRDWKPGAKTRTLEHVFWLERKQRVIGAIGDAGDGWLWGVLRPASKAKGLREMRLGNGTAPDKTSAIAAVERRIQELRDTGLPKETP
ncbi:MAG TPA: hypothetical protein VN756_09960 [Solirubrobacterales bacterium]|nr:hypothetical protein [Solirubrobacterales bacterium]